ncbi:hypothetical protein [uncultured Umboniibacter sp.]|uniref:hypothetical protein n=1 Tax=uncultured Umboniibacter sp. TaxID=1798917 RepID=UPI00260CC73C|nr:hypothetical protein [uncultured Umboniibacter sp.]
MNLKQPISTLKTQSQFSSGATRLTPISKRYWQAMVAVALVFSILTGSHLRAASDNAIIRIEVRLSELTVQELRQLSAFCESQIASSDQCENIDELFRYSTTSELSEDSSEDEIRNYLGQWLNSADLRTLEPCDFRLERLDDGSISLITVNRE